MLTRKQALAKIKTDPLITEAIALEPDLEEVLKIARTQKNVPGYNRISKYEELRNRINDQVGWYAKHESLRTTEHHGAFIAVIVALLPADDIDLYPDGKPEEDESN